MTCPNIESTCVPDQIIMSSSCCSGPIVFRYCLWDVMVVSTDSTTVTGLFQIKNQNVLLFIKTDSNKYSLVSGSIHWLFLATEKYLPSFLVL